MPNNNITLIASSGNTLVNASGTSMTGVVFIGINNYSGTPENNRVYIDAMNVNTINNIPVGVLTSNTQVFTTGVTSTSIQLNRFDGSISSGLYSSIAGGKQNIANANYSLVVGGQRNLSSGLYSSVVGGQKNSATTVWSSIAGGYRNSIYGSQSFIGGGSLNKTFVSAPASVIAGGTGNKASGNTSSVLGGFSNTASGDWSVIGGGYINTASGKRSSVLNGFHNTAFGLYSTIIGGSGNTVSGSGSTIINGVGYSLIADNTTLVPRLKIANLPTGTTVHSLNSDASGNVFRKQQENGIVSFGSFTGTDLSYDVVFANPFDDTNFSVLITGQDQRSWTYSNKTVTGFRIESNSPISITGETSYWAQHI